MTDRLPGIDAVILDMDGLLLDSEGLYRDGFRRARANMGLPPDDALFHSLIGTNHESGGRILTAAMGAGADEFTRRWHAENRMALTGPIPLKPRVRDALERLAALGTPRIVATSTRTGPARRRLDNAGLGALLPALIGGDEVRRGKPDPEIFLAAAARLGFVPRRCAAFEDSANGVRAAVAAGMVVTQVPDLVAPSDDLLSLGHRVAPDLWSGLAGLELI
ncbi:HAD family phosphatase [Jannaschia sp. S6380]|uniref:HAD family hydrolase n=1 Tax=Jannaschia sp. S6380 TaxID=2926408 RepID=UPI001FF13FCD|nr:HAD family phosphatase [Jannaschia sp. S6380]